MQRWLVTMDDPAFPQAGRAVVECEGRDEALLTVAEMLVEEAIERDPANAEKAAIVGLRLPECYRMFGTAVNLDTARDFGELRPTPIATVKLAGRDASGIIGTPVVG